MQRRLIVIAGSSGVGKTTLARALQEALMPALWLHFSSDTLFYGLPRPVVERVDRHNDWSAFDANALVDATHACARTLLERGHRVILDVVVLSDEGAGKLLRAFEGFDPWLVDLTCAWDEIERRTLARGDRTLAEAAHGFEAKQRLSAAHHAIDSTGVAPERLAARLAAIVRSGGSAA